MHSIVPHQRIAAPLTSCLTHIRLVTHIWGIELDQRSLIDDHGYKTDFHPLSIVSFWMVPLQAHINI